MESESIRSILEDAFEIFDLETKLNDLQWLILNGSTRGQTYQQIADLSGYDHDYIKQVAAGLWRLLSTMTGETVSKHNFRSVLRRYQNSHSTLASRPQQAHQSPSNLAYSLNIQIEAQEIRWVGRQFLIRKLSQKILADCRILSLVGITGIGKSSLAARLSLEPAIATKYPQIQVIHCSDPKDTFEDMASHILGKHLIQDKTQQNPTEIIPLLINHLQQNSILLILDTLEEIVIAKENGAHQFVDSRFEEFFTQFLKAESMSARCILTSQISPPMLAQGRYLCRTHVESLQGLSLDESLDLFSTWEITANNLIEKDYLQRYCQAYEGHPLALQVIAGEIIESPFHRNVTAYWNEFGAEIEALEHSQLHSINQQQQHDMLNLANYSLSLTDLVEQRVEQTFKRLREQYFLAYQLLCMGSIFRGAVDKEGWYFLICNATPKEQIIAFQTLQRRFLLDVHLENSKVRYRLHSLIRSVALEHLEQLDTELSV